ncbi:MAG: type II secretion system protein GspL [Gallionella sp.]|nr:type II secretion system protein GspL [Gallionella sp.]
MNTLVINIPAQACAPTPQSLLTRSCVYTRLGKQSALELQGTATLGELSTSIKFAKQVILLLAAVDVTLLRMNIPPLSASKLRAALPNLVEERVLADPYDCLISCSIQPGGMQTVAVTQRAWVELLLQTLRGLGAQRIIILPSQTSLPLLEGQISGALQDMGSTLNLRLSEHEGIGLLIDPAAGLMDTLHTLIPAAPVTLFLDEEMQRKHGADLAADIGVTIKALNGTHFQMPDISLDLAAGVASAHQNSWDWRPWRWPLVLGAALLLTQTVALNLDWWHLSRESLDLRTSMKQIYLSAYPNETVILDPLLQMQQKIAASRHNAGLSAADDFDSLLAEFGAAWSATQPPTSITAIEYHEHKLMVSLKDKVNIDGLQNTLAQRGLALEVAQDNERSWTLRSRK